MKKLKQTHVIHSILKRFCHNKTYSATAGWGALDVAAIRDITDASLKDLVYHFTHPRRAPRNYWNGKNL